jgi:hypothetical protein
MLFDLRGRRRRAVQATYLMLALLMGGGLVLFGIGGDVSGGLVDAFRGGGGPSGDTAREDAIEKSEERLKARPTDERVLQILVRDYYVLATSKREESSTAFPADAREDLRKAAAYWKRYEEAAEKPNPDTAVYALQIFDAQALNQPKEAARVAAILAEDSNDSPSYLRLVSYAAKAGDKRTADLAAQKAVELAPKSQRKLVKQQAEALKKPQQEQQPSG